MKLQRVVPLLVLLHIILEVLVAEHLDWKKVYHYRSAAILLPCQGCLLLSKNKAYTKVNLLSSVYMVKTGVFVVYFRCSVLHSLMLLWTSTDAEVQVLNGLCITIYSTVDWQYVYNCFWIQYGMQNSFYLKCK